MRDRCSHKRTFREPCPDCDRVWRESCIRDLHRYAARLGYRVVPICEDPCLADTHSTKENH